MATGDKVKAREIIDQVIRALESDTSGNTTIRFAVQHLRKARPLLNGASPLNRAAPKNQEMTWQIGDQIRAFAPAHPEMSRQEIGRHFEVDGGRVTEALQGMWMRPPPRGRGFF